MAECSKLAARSSAVFCLAEAAAPAYLASPSEPWLVFNRRKLAVES